MSKKTGIILVKVRGKTLQGMPGVKMNFGGMERTEVIANSEVVGFSESPVPSVVDVTLPHDAATDVAEIQSWNDVVLVVKPDAGPSYKINHAFVANALELSDRGGGFAVQFKGKKAEKV